MDFITKTYLRNCTWQAFERLVCRLLISDGYSNVRMCGGKGDKGADVIATKYGKRWIFQVKQWKKPVGLSVIDDTLKAMTYYEGQVAIIVAANGFENAVYEQQFVLKSNHINLQLWSSEEILDHFKNLPNKVMNEYTPHPYQEEAIRAICESFYDDRDRRALISLATGLGKTFVAAEAIRRISNVKKVRTLVLADKDALILQLEKSFWPFLTPDKSTIIWNGYEHPDPTYLKQFDFVFACINTVSEALKRGEYYDYDIILVDECHHAGSSTYRGVLKHYANESDPPLLIGLSATPWRADEEDIEEIFGEPKIAIDMIYGINHGFLSNVDYRIHTDNINWDSLKNIEGQTFSPKQFNRTFFITQWDDAVVEELRRVWGTVSNPRAIIFCSNIDHANFMRDRIRALSFCNVETINSKNEMSLNNKILSDFSDNKVNAICAVDIFNEGLDVPDVNILVFQRVTHSRRIFIQQLGRGLRKANGKDKVVVLDFVSDIRRFAAGLELKSKIIEKGTRLELPNKVIFTRVSGEDPKAEEFLRNWLVDVSRIEDLDDNAAELTLPPHFN